MCIRLLVALAMVSLCSSTLRAQEKAKLPYDSSFTLRLTGELAEAYISAKGLPPAGEGVQIETSARIAQVLPDGRVRVEHSSTMKRPGEQDRLVTLSATVSPDRFKTHTTRRGTEAYSSPAALKNGAQPQITSAEHTGYVLELSEVKDLKIRVWNVAREIGG